MLQLWYMVDWSACVSIQPYILTRVLLSSSFMFRNGLPVEMRHDSLGVSDGQVEYRVSSILQGRASSSTRTRTCDAVHTHHSVHRASENTRRPFLFSPRKRVCERCPAKLLIRRIWPSPRSACVPTWVGTKPHPEPFAMLHPPGHADSVQG